MSQVATAIAAAVEQLGDATRVISVSVHMMAGATPRATTAMHQASGVSEAAGRTSREVPATVGEVALVAGTLRQEVDQSVAAMRADESNRRHYERLPGNGIMASPRVQSHPARDTKGLGVSRGGIAISGDLELAAVEAVEVSLLGMDTAAKGRVARSQVGRLAVAFRQDPANLAVIERMLAMHWPSPILARAA
jgi:hypothetical protein